MGSYIVVEKQRKGYNIGKQMRRGFIYTKQFDKNWEELQLTDDDLILLENEISDNPKIGDVIKRSGGLRKMRFALPNKGKSHGVRVLYADFVVLEKIFMVNVYPKSVKENITQTEIQAYNKIIGEAEQEYRRLK